MGAHMGRQRHRRNTDIMTTEQTDVRDEVAAREARDALAERIRGANPPAIHYHHQEPDDDQDDDAIDLEAVAREQLRELEAERLGFLAQRDRAEAAAADLVDPIRLARRVVAVYDRWHAAEGAADDTEE